MEQIGRYKVAGELGRGAMGVVYRAEDPTIGRTVAIKTIRLTDLTDPKEQERLRERLMREAQSAGMLSHPGIVTIYDVAEKDGLAYVFMEFVNGPTLEKLMERDRLPKQEQLLEVIRQTAAALDYAHRKGIVHRDIKPANIMIHDDGSAKIADFGVARIVSQKMTQTGAVMGTPSYMSPEQIQGHAVDGRADQWALAVIVYEILTGEKPFVGDSMPALVYRIVREEPAAPQRINPSLNGAVEAVVRRALNKDPEKRYPTCTEFGDALAAALKTAKGWRILPPGTSQSMPTVARSTGPRPQLQTQSEALPAAPEAPAGQGSRKSMRVGFLMGAAAGAVLLAALIIVPKLQRADVPVEREGPPNTAPAVSTAAPPPAAAATVKPQEVEAPEPSKPAPAAPPKPAAPQEKTIAIQTTPAGATVIIDNNAEIGCTSPCSVSLLPGRHSLAAKLEGHRPALKIFEVPRDAEISLSLDAYQGTLVVRTTPPGATITLNGKRQDKVTPAVLTLAAGKYKMVLSKEGLPDQEDELEIKDGALKNYDYSWGR
ncbi:MAG: serine/threonine-protein kinase [Bryobacteraceae bacterium]|nr:serine/threonine-protein kinase [Bryobacteraceae bacterium]